MKESYLRLLSLAVLLCCGAVFAAETVETAASLFQQGVTAYESGDAAGALKLFRRMQEEFPRSARAVRGWEYIALCENKLGDPYAAFEAYQEIWDNHKEFSKMQVITRNQMRIGNHYMEYKRYSVAEEIFTKILENAPYSEAAPAAQYSLGMAQYNLKKYAAARDSFQNVCQNFPTSQLVDDSAFMLGVVDTAAAVEADYDQTSTDQAIASFREYIREFPTAEHVGDAQLHISALRNRKAQSVYDQAYFYDYSGHAKSAIMHYELLLSEYPDTECAEKAKVRLAALKGEPVVGLGKKDKVTYVDKSGEKAASQAPATDSAFAPAPASNVEKLDDGIRQPKAAAAPTEASFTAPTSQEVADAREKRTTALAQPSSTMGKTGDDWTANQSKQTMNEYMQDPAKKEELVTFMKDEYQKEAQAQAASQALLKLYQESNPDAVPPPASTHSAASYVDRQLSSQTVAAARTSEESTKVATAVDTKTGHSVEKVENVWAPLPGSEVKEAPKAPAQPVAAVQEAPKAQPQAPVKNSGLEATAVTSVTPKTVRTQPATSVSASIGKHTVISSDEWSTVNEAMTMQEDDVKAAAPKLSTLSESELAAAKASGTPMGSKQTVSYGSEAMPSFGGQTVVTSEKPAPKAQTSELAFQPVTKTSVKAEVKVPAADSAPALSTAAVTEEIKNPGTVPAASWSGNDAAGKLVDSILPPEEKENAAVLTEGEVKELPVTVKTEGPRVTRSLVKPSFEEEKESAAPAQETQPAAKETPSTGAVTQDVSSLLPAGLDESEPELNKDAIVPAPQGVTIRQLPDPGKVSTAISAAQYQRVVEEKNVKSSSSEAELINQYKQAYTLVQRAESYAKQNDNVNARFYYSQALDAFTALKASAPANWRHMEVLDTRIQKCREELHRID